MAWLGHVQIMTYLVFTFGLVFLNYLWKGDITLVVLVVLLWPLLKRELTVHFFVLLLQAVKLGEGWYAWWPICSWLLKWKFRHGSWWRSNPKGCHSSRLSHAKLLLLSTVKRRLRRKLRSWSVLIMEWTERMTSLKLLLTVICLVPTKKVTASVTFRTGWRPIAWKGSKIRPEATPIQTELLICIQALLVNSRAQISKGRWSVSRDKILWLMWGASKLVLSKATIYSWLILWRRAEIHHFSWVVFHRKVDRRIHLATSIADLTSAVCSITSFLCIKTWSNHEWLARN